LPTTFIGPNVSWFSYVSASADVINSRFDATQTVGFGFNIPPQPGPSPFSASASGSDHRVDFAGHFNAQTGLVTQFGPQAALFFAATMGYISDVPFVSYPSIANGIRTTASPMDHPAQLASTSQMSFGIVWGLNFRY
jgi:hypothetical protein